ncbi:MAG TPA: glycosyltransferase family 39 protein [Candidatus Dormibacteraeota bacterium]|nr:glycosyltransferase family 39 protein [Candidatus Dormibacteraeota bacterium]
MKPPPLDRPGLVAGLLFVLALSILFARLGEGHLANFDDCYYAEKAKEMVRGGDWVTPHFAGTPRLDNPPLFLWLQSLAFLALGVSDRAAIFWSALSGALCIPLLYRLARLRLRLDPFESWSAAIVLLTTQYFLKYARHAMLDVFLTLLFLVAIYAYVRAVQGERRSFLLLGLATGLGILTKSVLGLFPLMVAVLHLLGTGRGRTLRDGWFLGGLALTALVSAPWYVANFLRFGGQLLEEHFRWLLWQRGLGVGGGARPWWSYLDYLRELGQVYWPWLPLAVAGLVIAIRQAAAPAAAAPPAPAPPAAETWSRRDTARLLLLWLFAVVGIMSLGAEKKLWYVMAAFPCLALLAGLAAGAWIRGESLRRRVQVGGFALCGAAALALWLFPIPLSKERRPDLQRMAVAARTQVPPGMTLLNLNAGYWKTVNQFLYYSDHDITQPLRDPALVRRGLKEGGVALLSAEGFASVAEGDTAAYTVIAASGAWRIVQARATSGAPESRPPMKSRGTGLTPAPG